jgi:hypothetical protein
MVQLPVALISNEQDLKLISKNIRNVLSFVSNSRLDQKYKLYISIANSCYQNKGHKGRQQFLTLFHETHRLLGAFRNDDMACNNLQGKKQEHQEVKVRQ